MVRACYTSVEARARKESSEAGRKLDAELEELREEWLEIKKSIDSKLKRDKDDASGSGEAADPATSSGEESK